MHHQQPLKSAFWGSLNQNLENNFKTLKMKLFGIFAFAAVAMAELDYDSIGLKKPSSSAVDKVSIIEGHVTGFKFWFRDQENATVTSFPTPWTSPNCGSVLQETQTTKTHIWPRDANSSAKRVNLERVNTKYTARPDTDGFSERAKEKSPQEPVPIKWASQLTDFSMKYLKSGCPWKISSLQGRSNFIISVLWRVYIILKT